MKDEPRWFDQDFNDIASEVRSLGSDKKKEFLLNVRALVKEITKSPEFGTIWHESGLQWPDVRWRHTNPFGGRRFQVIYYAPSQGSIKMLRLLRPGEAALAKIRIALGAQHPPPT